MFYYCTYEGAVNLDAIKNAEEREALEGMTDQQLRPDAVPTPQRAAPETTDSDGMAAEQVPNDFNHSLVNLKPFFEEI